MLICIPTLVTAFMGQHLASVSHGLQQTDSLERNTDRTLYFKWNL